jgi:hypothetical protein
MQGEAAKGREEDGLAGNEEEREESGAREPGGRVEIARGPAGVHSQQRDDTKAAWALASLGATKTRLKRHPSFQSTRPWAVAHASWLRSTLSSAGGRDGGRWQRMPVRDRLQPVFSCFSSLCPSVLPSFLSDPGGESMSTAQEFRTGMDCPATRQGECLLFRGRRLLEHFFAARGTYRRGLTRAHLAACGSEPVEIAAGANWCDASSSPPETSPLLPRAGKTSVGSSGTHFARG